MKTLGFVLIGFAILILPVTFYLKTSADARFAEATENVNRARKSQEDRLKASGALPPTGPPSTNFYIQPDPEDKARWNTFFNFSIPVTFVLLCVGGYSVYSSRKLPNQATSLEESDPLETD